MSERLEELKVALNGRYEIERELGHGGMATVYLARDVRHKREVAVKVLRPDLASAVGPERFLREIDIAANLNHPHIMALFDSGEADSFLYYVMPVVDGETLRERIEREKQLPLDDSLEIAREVADALSYAHSHGVVHRDIKPENIMLGSGHALVADFGIARAITDAGGEHLTETGITIGTPAYMSPEQAGGEDLDGRSDIYSLGCVLYEMLTGEPPFTGATSQAIIARQMHEAPRSLTVVRPTVPPSVEYAVRTALAKVPADRPLTAQRFVELFDAPVPIGEIQIRRRVRRVLGALLTIVILAAVGIGLWKNGGGVSQSDGFDPARIAVLYFDDFSEEQDLGYLATGFTEAVIHELTQVQALQIISRNGVRPYRYTPVPLDSIARAFRVGTVIQGSVTRSGEQLRVTVQIIETAGMTHLANVSLDRPWGDWLTMVDEIVGDIAREFREELGVEVLLRERRARSTNSEAWEFLQRAEQLRQDHRPLMMAGNVQAAERTLLQADSLLALTVSLDAAWVEPVVLRGWVSADLAALLGPSPGVYHPGWIAQGLQFSTQALELERGEPLALELRGTLRYRLWPGPDSEGVDLLVAAEQDLRAAVQSNPSQASAWATLSELLQWAKGDFREAKQAALRAYQEDAFLAEAKSIIILLAGNSLELEEFDDALGWAQEGRRRFPDAVDFPAIELGILTQAGEPNAGHAWELVAEIKQLTSPQNLALFASIANMQVGAVLARAGLRDSGIAVVERTRSQASPNDPGELISYDEAHAWLVLGERDRALRALDTYLEANPQDKTYIARDSWFKDLQDNSYFKQLTDTGG